MRVGVFWLFMCICARWFSEWLRDVAGLQSGSPSGHHLSVAELPTQTKDGLLIGLEPTSGKFENISNSLAHSLLGLIGLYPSMVFLGTLAQVFERE